MSIIGNHSYCYRVLVQITQKDLRVPEKEKKSDRKTERTKKTKASHGKGTEEQRWASRLAWILSVVGISTSAAQCMWERMG